ncbi:MAG: hypothetical protein V7767_10115, partial [Leeuwenhoekiella sp.]
MKNLIACTLVLFSVTMFAQEGPRHKKQEAFKNISAEDMAQLQTKRLTLALVLDDKQQKQVYDLNLDSAKK